MVHIHQARISKSEEHGSSCTERSLGMLATNGPSHIVLKRTLALLNSEAGGQPLACSPPAEGIQGYLPQQAIGQPGTSTKNNNKPRTRKCTETVEVK